MGDSIETLKKIFDCMCCKLKNDKKNERNEIVNGITDSAGNVDVKDDDLDFLEKEVPEEDVPDEEDVKKELIIDNNTNGKLDERHQVLPPQWILNELEPPIETIDLGGFITVVYSEEQQKRLNVIFIIMNQLMKSMNLIWNMILIFW